MHLLGRLFRLLGSHQRRTENPLFGIAHLGREPVVIGAAERDRVVRILDDAGGEPDGGIQNCLLQNALGHHREPRFGGAAHAGKELLPEVTRRPVGGCQATGLHPIAGVKLVVRRLEEVSNPHDVLAHMSVGIDGAGSDLGHDHSVAGGATAKASPVGSAPRGRPRGLDGVYRNPPHRRKGLRDIALGTLSGTPLAVTCGAGIQATVGTRGGLGSGMISWLNPDSRSRPNRTLTD